MYPLEHFYYGQLVHHGQPTGETRILAQSRNITETDVQVALKQALLPAHPTIVEGSWGVVRGNKQVPFLFIQSQKGRFGQTTFHVVLLSSDLLRQVSGQVKSLGALVQAQLPTYEMLGDTLPPIDFAPLPDRTIEQQVDDLLQLMTLTGNNTRKIEPLLASVVQNKTLIIQNAPQNNQERLDFIQGLLTLLPSSTRFAVTFTTYHEKQSTINSQITFSDESLSQADNLDAVLYDWQDKTLIGDGLDDDYSRFIVGQLRLDTELALEQAEALTPVAGWRFRHGDNLRDALAYASNRSKLDKAIMNNLPAPVQEVSRVLAEDPTLPESLRVAYAEHLITLSIALGDMSACDPVAVTLQTNPPLERKVLQQLQDVVKNGDGGMIFEMLHHWMDNPLSPQTPEWMTLLRQSALAELEDCMAENDLELVVSYLDDIYQVNQNRSLSPVLSKIIERTLPLSGQSTDIASRIFLLALTYFDTTSLQKLLRLREFTHNLPRPIKRFLAGLAQPDNAKESGVLIAASEAFGEEHRQKILIQLLKITQEANAYTLIDAPTLAALVDFAVTSEGIDYASLLLDIYRALENRQETLQEPSNRYLLQIPLIVGRYDLVARGMIEQSRDFYRGERQYDYIQMVQDLFAQTPMSSEQGKRALENIKKHGIKGIPFIAASCGVLEATQWSVDLAHIAQENSTWLMSHPNYLEVIHPEMVIALIQYYFHTQDNAHLERTAHLLPTCAAYKNEKVGLRAMHRAYEFLVEQERGEKIGFEIIRQYVREAPSKTSLRAVQYFSKKTNTLEAQRLEFAHNFSQFWARLDLETLAVSVSTAVDLLKNNQESYIANARKPSRKHLIDFVTDLTPRLTLENRKQLVSDMRKLTYSLYTLGKHHQNDSHSKLIPALVKGQENPRSAIDVLYLVGGHLLRGRQATVKLSPNLIPNPFSEQELGDFVVHVGVTADLFQAMEKHHQHIRQSPLWNTDNILQEIDSMVESLRRPDIELLKKLGQDMQYLGSITHMIYEATDGNVLEDGSRLAKRLDQQAVEPASALEAYRFIYSYFNREN